MTMQDHDNDTNEKPEIAFTVDTTESIGEPVFPDDNLEASAEVSVLEVTAEVTTYESEDAAEVTAEETAEETTEESADESLELEAEDGQGSDEEISVDAEILEEEDSSLGIKEELTLGGKIESIVFASPKPMRAVEIHELLIDQGYTLKEVQDTCDELIEFYRDRAGGFHLKYIKRMGYQFQTTAAAKSLMERQFSSRPRPLSRAA